MLLLALGVLLLGAAGWGFNFIQQWFAARVVGDVVLQLREDVFAATMQPRPVVLRGIPIGQDRQPGHLGHAGLLRRGLAGHQPFQPGAAGGDHVRLAGQHQRLAHLPLAGDDAVGGGHRA